MSERRAAFLSLGISLLISLAFAGLAFWQSARMIDVEIVEWAIVTTFLSAIVLRPFFSQELLEIQKVQSDLSKFAALMNRRFNQLSRQAGDNHIDEGIRDHFIDKTLNPAAMDEAWIKLMFLVTNKINATSYVDISKRAYPAGGWIVQKGLAEMNRAVCRVFIVDDCEELRRLPNEAVTCGSVKYICKNRLDKIVTDFFKDEHLETIDFGVFDDKYIFLWHLDPKTRTPVSGRVIEPTDVRFKSYLRFFDLIIRHGYHTADELVKANGWS